MRETGADPKSKMQHIGQRLLLIFSEISFILNL